MSFLTAFWITMSILLGIPFLVYVTVKLGTLGFLQGRHQFISEQKENCCNGNEKREK